MVAGLVSSPCINEQEQLRCSSSLTLKPDIAQNDGQL